MVLGHHRGKARPRSLPKQLDVIDASQRDRRTAMHMRVDRPYQQVVDAFFDLGDR